MIIVMFIVAASVVVLARYIRALFRESDNLPLANKQAGVALTTNMEIIGWFMACAIASALIVKAIVEGAE